MMQNRRREPPLTKPIGARPGGRKAAVGRGAAASGRGGGAGRGGAAPAGRQDPRAALRELQELNAQVEEAQRVLARERAALQSLQRDAAPSPSEQAAPSSVYGDGNGNGYSGYGYAPSAAGASPPRGRRVSQTAAPPFAVDEEVQYAGGMLLPAAPGGARPARGAYMSGLAELRGTALPGDGGRERDAARAAYVADLDAQVAAKRAAAKAAKAERDAWDARHGFAEPAPQQATGRARVPPPGQQQQQQQQKQYYAPPAAAAADDPYAAVAAQLAGRGGGGHHGLGMGAAALGGLLPGGRDASPPPARRGGFADLAPGLSDAQRSEADARRRQLVADLDAQVAQRKATAAAAKAAERAREAAEERRYNAAVEAERIAAHPGTSAAPAPLVPWGADEMDILPPNERGKGRAARAPPPLEDPSLSLSQPSAAPRHSYAAPTPGAALSPAARGGFGGFGAMPPLPPAAPRQSASDAVHGAAADALAMLRLMRAEQVRMRDEFMAMQAEARATAAERDQLLYQLAAAEAAAEVATSAAERTARAAAAAVAAAPRREAHPHGQPQYARVAAAAARASLHVMGDGAATGVPAGAFQVDSALVPLDAEWDEEDGAFTYRYAEPLPPPARAAPPSRGAPAAAAAPVPARRAPITPARAAPAARAGVTPSRAAAPGRGAATPGRGGRGAGGTTPRVPGSFAPPYGSNVPKRRLV